MQSLYVYVALMKDNHYLHNCVSWRRACSILAEDYWISMFGVLHRLLFAILITILYVQKIGDP